MFQEPYIRKVAALLGVMGIVALGAYTYSAIKQARYMYQGPTTISVVGEGEVLAKPDIATFSFTVQAQEADATAAQNKANETMSGILAYLKEAGVEEKDIKTTGYNLNPRYEYPQTVCTPWSCPPQGEPKVIGYELSQSVMVKVRDTDKVGELVSNVGGKGAQNVSGVSLTIDDEETYKAQAREAAIADAKQKAEALAKNLGVRIVRMNGFWEEQGGPMPYGMGMGGMEMAKSADMTVPTPAQLPQGENTITSRVNISYEIK